MLYFTVISLVCLSTLVLAQSCDPRPSGSISPSIASGYQFQVVATGLAAPRGIILDNVGNLLVVEQGAGKISAHTLREENGCVSVTGSRNVTDDLNLNHGIELSSDGKTLYASSTEAAYSFEYDATGQAVSAMQTLVSNMTTQDHTTRTLLLSRKVPGMLVISRGSTSNIDFEATMLSSGHSQIKAFNISALNGTAYDFSLDGTLLGWGLRNDVGVAEHPASGAIWGIENSADQLHRDGVDIHEDNPAEKLNFLGYLNGTQGPYQGQNFGYPWCFAAWKPNSLPNNSNVTVGSQFAIDASQDSDNQNRSDSYCAEQAPPSLVFQSHMAPLDIKFNASGREGWVPFHGSWNRDAPTGYKLSRLDFNDDGMPVDNVTSTTAATDILTNMDNSKCPGNCFRPVALAMDTRGRIFMSSDASGEIYMVSKVTGSASTSSGPSASSTASQSSGASNILRFPPSRCYVLLIFISIGIAVAL